MAHVDGSSIWPVAQARLRRVGFALTCLGQILFRPEQRPVAAQQFFYATERDTFERTFAAFGSSPAGRRLLANRPDSIAVLRDRTKQAAAASRSLARAYADFMTRCGIDESLYLAGAIAAGQRFGADDQRAWLRRRIEAGHDLRHVLTGYGIEPLGEVCLLAFRLGQTGHRGVGAMLAISVAILACRCQRGLLGSVREAYRHGRQARSLDLFAWEERFDEPLAALRRELGVAPPLRYQRALAG